MNRPYPPMLAATAAAPFSSPDYLFEIKWDGVRAVAYVAGTVALLSRNGNDLAPQFPELAELKDLAPGTVLDGEIVVMRQGKPDMQSLLPRLQTQGRLPAGAPPATYIVFDILEKDGEPLIAQPLILRREILKSSVREGSHVILSEPVETRGEDYFRAAVAQGLEGIMAKRKDSPYEPGVRSSAWLKVRAEKTCDCIIAGYTQGQGSRGPAFGALLLALYEDREALPSRDRAAGHRPVYIGKVGSGFSDQDLARLRELFALYPAGTPTLAEFHAEEPVVWLRPELVCEVAYQQVTRDRRLRIPRFRRLRTDRRPDDCRTSQLDVQPVPAQERPVRAGSAGTRMRIPDAGISSGMRWGRGTGVSPSGAGPMRRHAEPAGTGNAAHRAGAPRQTHRQEQPEEEPSRPVPRDSGDAGRGTGPAVAGDEKTGEWDKSPPPVRTAPGAPAGRPTERYRGKRNFSKTPEPEGDTTMTESIFVIQEHHARHLHYDFRLERDGVLKSWAVPKGVPEEPGAKHLAVAVEDHPLDYATFEGAIPEGEYGAGTVAIWDTGTYEARHWDDKKIEVILHGKRITGHYVLVRFNRAGKNEWLIFKAGSA